MGGRIVMMILLLVGEALAQTCMQAPSGITGWWTGDDTTADSAGGRNAVLRGEAAFALGLLGDAFLLGGNGDFVEVPHDPALNVGAGDFTIALWVYFNTTDGEQVLAEKYVEDYSQVEPGWTLTKLSDNSLRFGRGSVALIVDSSLLALPAQTWIHIAARRAAGAATLLINGTPVASGPLAYNADTNASLKFGHRGNPIDTPGSMDIRGFYLNGRIDEVEYFVGRALSDVEIQGIVNAVGRPVIASIADLDPDRMTGIRIIFSGGAGASRHDLYRDNTLVVTGYASAAAYAPGDTAWHRYFIRASKGPCSADSTGVQGVDAMGSVTPPEIAAGYSASDAQTWSADKATQSWPAEGSSAGYRLYRGSLDAFPGLLTGDTDGCLRYDGTAARVDLSSDNPSTAAGRLYWYLVTAYNGTGSGPAGNATAGPRRLDSTGACP